MEKKGSKEYSVVLLVEGEKFNLGEKISIRNRMRPSRIKHQFSRAFSNFSQNCPSGAATRAICENFENTSEIYP